MIDLRSDTITQPSATMRKAMAEAETGDDVLREDPTVRKLEEQAAALTGKEAALFVPSGTFANQLALFVWCPKGEEVYVSEYSHIVRHEAGAPAHIAGAFLRCFVPANGHWAEWDDIEPRIRKVENVHFPRPALICLENALSDGMVQPIASMASIKVQAEKAGLPIHLDGARLFNAACHLKAEAAAIARQTDSVMFCLSKGLGAPVGSLLCGSRDFIGEALYKRKIMGGGMRQVGILAAAGLTALQEELPRLGEDHQKARELAAAFEGFGAVFEVINPIPDINMVFLRLRRGGAEREQLFLTLLGNADVRTYSPQGGVFRFVTHRDVSEEQLISVLKSLPRIAEALK